MTNPTNSIIRAYVGELIQDAKGTIWSITEMKQDGTYCFINMHNPVTIEICTLGVFNLCHHPLKRVGILKGIELLEGEDWLCHDKRCYPGVLAGGCSGCIYSGLTKERKRYFEPGDIVWVPSIKREKKIIETSLFYQREKGGTPIKYNFQTFINSRNLIWSVRFKLETYPVYNYYRWDEIRLVKRKRHLINPTQLNHICNDLCLFGPYSKTAKTCWECETGRVWRQIQK